MPASPAQRQLIIQFSSITGATEKHAVRLLRATGWKLDAAVDSFYSGGDSLLQSSPSARDPMKDNLNKLFDGLKSTNDELDTVHIESTARYVEELGVSLENAEFLVLMEAVQAPGMGEMSRSGFVDGWRVIGADTIPKQKAYIIAQSKALSTDLNLFKQVYRQSFFSQKDKAQKALPLEYALVTWQLLFSPPGRPWITRSTDWGKTWNEFLESKWTRSVNKDMWNQTFEFYLKTLEDETLSFWSEDSAWPGVIDDFVLWVKEKRGGSPEKMETD